MCMLCSEWQICIFSYLILKCDTILEHVVSLYLRLETPSIIFCSNPAKPQAVPFITLTAGVSDLCVSLTRKSCQHASYPSVKKKSETPSPFVFDHCAPVCSVPFSVYGIKNRGLSEEANKGCRFDVYSVRWKRKSGGEATPLPRLQPASCTLPHPAAAAATSPCLSPSLLFLPLSPQGQRHLKGLYLGVRPTKALCWISSICVWITLEPQIKKCWTRRVRSCGIYHCGFCTSLLVWEEGTAGCYFDWWLQRLRRPFGAHSPETKSLPLPNPSFSLPGNIFH